MRADVLSFDPAALVLLGAQTIWRATLVSEQPRLVDLMVEHDDGRVATFKGPRGPRPAWLWTEGNDLLWGGCQDPIVRITPFGDVKTAPPTTPSVTFLRSRRVGHAAFGSKHFIYDVRTNSRVRGVENPSLAAWVGDALWFYDPRSRSVVAGERSLPWTLRLSAVSAAAGRDAMVLRTGSRAVEPDGIFSVSRDGEVKRLATVPHAMGGDKEVWVDGEWAVWAEHDDGPPFGRFHVAAESRICAAPVGRGERVVLFSRGSTPPTAVRIQDVFGGRVLLDLTELSADGTPTSSLSLVRLPGRERTARG